LPEALGKFELIIALFRGKREYDDVDFKVECRGIKPFLMQCSINMVQTEDGSHESWNIEGYAKYPQKMALSKKRLRFKAYYNTLRRAGALTILEE